MRGRLVSPPSWTRVDRCEVPKGTSQRRVSLAPNRPPHAQLHGLVTSKHERRAPRSPSQVARPVKLRNALSVGGNTQPTNEVPLGWSLVSSLSAAGLCCS